MPDENGPGFKMAAARIKRDSYVMIPTAVVVATLTSLANWAVVRGTSGTSEEIAARVAIVESKIDSLKESIVLRDKTDDMLRQADTRAMRDLQDRLGQIDNKLDRLIERKLGSVP